MEIRFVSKLASDEKGAVQTAPFINNSVHYNSVHCFTINDRHLALDIHSGAIHLLDDTAYAILTGNTKGHLSEIQAEALAEARAEIEILTEKGQLFSPPRDESGEISFTLNRNPLVKSLCLHMAHDCNLRCRYCFAGEGDYGALSKKSRTLMSPEIGKKAIDFIIENSGARRNLEVDFFGGEPTLNFETVKIIVEYARVREKEANKNFRFTFTTNGLLLDDDKIEYINRHMDNVVLSLDGRKEVNDRMRKTRSQNAVSCYDMVLPKFRELTEARGHQNYYMRGTYTRENLDFASDVLHMADLGFSQISVEPVIASPDAEYAVQEEDIPALCKEYERLAGEMLCRSERDGGFNFFHFMLDLTNGPCVAKRITGCGAGTEYLAVTPEGDLYPCHQFVGDERFRLGQLATDRLDPQIQEQFSQLNVYTKPECRECWAKYFCSGGCAASAYLVNGDIAKPDLVSCELQKKRIECALYLYAMKYNTNPHLKP